jgi:hypothetical protein
MMLSPAREKGFVHDPFVGVHFKMLDLRPRDGKPFEKVVHCLVSTEALQDCAAKDGMAQDNIEAIFDANRDLIEAIASAQYTAGTERPIVKSRDLVG